MCGKPCRNEELCGNHYASGFQTGYPFLFRPLEVYQKALFCHFGPLCEPRRLPPRDFALIVIARRLLHRSMPRLLHGLGSGTPARAASVR